MRTVSSRSYSVKVAGGSNYIRSRQGNVTCIMKPRRGRDRRGAAETAKFTEGYYRYCRGKIHG